MKKAVFVLELESNQDLPEDFLDDVGSYLGEGIEYYFDEFGAPVDTTVKFCFINTDKPAVLH